MAMVQVGMGLGRVVLLVGTGVTGSVILRNSHLSDFLSELQEFLREKGDGGDGGESVTTQLQRQVEALTRDFRYILPPTVIHVESGSRVMSALVVPAAAAGVLGYGYMWWKGISFSSIMYVTKQNMANAVSSMNKHLEQVQNSLAAARKHLTQHIQRVDDKLDQQKKIAGQIRDEATSARMKLQDIGSEMNNLKKLASNLDGKLDSIQGKQDYQLAGVSYLLQFIESNDGRLGLPDRQVKFIEQDDAARLEGMQRPAVPTRSGKQGEFPGLHFGLRLLALEESTYRGVGGAGLLRSTLANAAC